MTVHILIAEDEAPAREELKFLLGDLWPDATLYEAEDGLQALEVVEHRPIQIAFLDINMPAADGLTVAAELLDMPAPPLVVFATAYDEHALRAFELAAVDYIVKPFDERRLQKTIARLQTLLHDQQQQNGHIDTLRTYVQQLIGENASTSPRLSKLWAERENENRVLVDYADILWAEARDKKVYIRLTDEELLVRYTLKQLIERLPQINFVRVHRGYLVNIDHVAEIVPWFSGGFLVRLKGVDTQQIPMSRRYAANLRDRIE